MFGLYYNIIKESDTFHIANYAMYFDLNFEYHHEGIPQSTKNAYPLVSNHTGQG